jgi:flagellar protein FliO/FliZ
LPGRGALSSALFACVALVCTALASVACAAETKPFAAPQVAEHAPVSSAGNLAQVTVSLLLVLGAVFLAAWVVRKLRGLGSVRSDVIKIIADLPLGTKERAVLIQVGSQQLLLGVTAGQINTLHVLAENVDDGPRATGDGQNGNLPSIQAHASGPMPQARPDFKSVLKRSLGL